jgi:hypothetical protein
MNKGKKANYVLLYGIAISATLLASLFVTNGHFAQKALAQGTPITNATTRAANQTGNADVNPSALVSQNGLNAVLNAARSTNATNTAVKNIINATGSNTTNKTGSMMTGTTTGSNTTGSMMTGTTTGSNTTGSNTTGSNTTGSMMTGTTTGSNTTGSNTTNNIG